ncbi:SCY1 family protein kinase [Pelomyxa schiedti]|nr:SCY1 family protein kinase [Pelomyxa schiedti]
MQFLTKLWGGSQSAFNYNLFESVPQYEGKSVWSLFRASRKDDGSQASVFVFDGRKHNTPRSEALARNALKRCRVLRHPCVLTHVDSSEASGSISLATEAVVPLEVALPEILKFPDSIAWGLAQIIKALDFLHESRLVHANVRIDSIFVTKSGDWKLGGLEYVTELDGVTAATFEKISEPRPPEINNIDEIKQGYPWSIDGWMLALMITSIFSGRIPPALADPHALLCCNHNKMRLRPIKLLESEFFSNPYIETLQFIEGITLKDPSEREAFFKKLMKTVDDLPTNVCLYKVLPHLVNAVDLQLYGPVTAKVLGPLLKIAKRLPQAEYSLNITPNVVKWFSSSDKTVRLNLLENLESFIEHLSPTMISDQIFPQVSTWFLDPVPALREATVRAMLFFVPKLGERTVNTEILRYFAKLQLDPEPCIRTNTTICLGRIASHLSEATRKKVLVAAFSRPLHDPFPPARMAGISAFSATKDFYAPNEIATHIIPAVSPLLVDNEKKVRDEAMRCISLFLSALQKALEAQNVEGKANGASNATSEPTDGSGVLSWALSLSKKIVYSATESGTAASGTSAPTSNQPATQSTTSTSTQKLDTTPSKAPVGSQRYIPPEEPVASSSDQNSGWDEEFDDFESVSLPKPPSAPQNLQTQIIKPQSQPQPPAQPQPQPTRQQPQPATQATPIHSAAISSPKSLTEMYGAMILNQTAHSSTSTTKNTYTPPPATTTTVTPPKPATTSLIDIGGGDDWSGSGWDDFDVTQDKAAPVATVPTSTFTATSASTNRTSVVDLLSSPTPTQSLLGMSPSSTTASTAPNTGTSAPRASRMERKHQLEMKRTPGRG